MTLGMGLTALLCLAILVVAAVAEAWNDHR